jgi:hypothetical protein
VIVSLLQTSSNAINSLSELMDSPFRLSMNNMDYNTKLVNVRSIVVQCCNVAMLQCCSAVVFQCVIVNCNPANTDVAVRTSCLYIYIYIY